jgi:hypothetical protein
MKGHKMDMVENPSTVQNPAFIQNAALENNFAIKVDNFANPALLACPNNGPQVCK